MKFCHYIIMVMVLLTLLGTYIITIMRTGSGVSAISNNTSVISPSPDLLNQTAIFNDKEVVTTARYEPKEITTEMQNDLSVSDKSVEHHSDQSANKYVFNDDDPCENFDIDAKNSDCGIFKVDSSDLVRVSRGPSSNAECHIKHKLDIIEEQILEDDIKGALHNLHCITCSYKNEKRKNDHNYDLDDKCKDMLQELFAQKTNLKCRDIMKTKYNSSERIHQKICCRDLTNMHSHSDMNSIHSKTIHQNIRDTCKNLGNPDETSGTKNNGELVDESTTEKIGMANSTEKK